mmetsp:Transcript_273/g.595  ORF Transcript_273/g.595 Transcript_273/m.595 type:complete len:284 (-) Transcript_273:255-1106(-)
MGKDGTLYTVKVYTFGNLPENAMLQVELLRDGGKVWWKPSSHDARSRFAAQPCIRYGPLVAPETLTEMRKIRFKITKGKIGWGVDRIEVVELKSDNVRTFTFGGRLGRGSVEVERVDGVFAFNNFENATPLVTPREMRTPRGVAGLAETGSPMLTPRQMARAGNMYMVHVYTTGKVPKNAALAVEFRAPPTNECPTSLRWWAPVMPTTRIRFDHKPPTFRYGPLLCKESMANTDRMRVWVLEGEGPVVVGRVELRSLASGMTIAFEHNASVGVLEYATVTRTD